MTSNCINFQRTECFVALFDILGFGNMIKSHKDNPEIVANIICNSIKELDDGYHELNEYYRIDYRWVIGGKYTDQDAIRFTNYSDTIIIYSKNIYNLEQYEIEAIFYYFLTAISSFFVLAFQGGLRLRGATSVGELCISDSVFIGEPIIDAYENEKKQEWIGCWITERTVSRLSDSFLRRHLDNNNIVIYDIPLKKSETKKGYTLNWVRLYSSHTGASPVLIDTAENNDNDIRKKIENTCKFIRFIGKVS